MFFVIDIFICKYKPASSIKILMKDDWNPKEDIMMTKAYEPFENDDGVSEVGEWFKNRSIFITGATGFLGKVLVERILRVAPVEKMYLLLRPKKGRDIRERLEDFLNSQVSDFSINI